MNYIYKSLSVNLLLILIFIFTPMVDMVAGWVITEESNDSFGNRSMQTTFIQGNMIRHETMSSIAIIDLDKKLVTMIFSQHRLYWTGTVQELKESSLDAYKRKMEEMLVGMTIESRDEFDSLFAELEAEIMDTNFIVPERNISIQKTNETENILGFTSNKYNIMVDGKITESVWHTNDVMPYNDINIEKMMSFMSQLSGGAGKSSVNQNPDYLNLMKTGLLLKSVEYSTNNEYQVVVTNIRETTIVPEIFEPPINYTKARFSDILNLMPVSQGYDEEW